MGERVCLAHSAGSSGARPVFEPDAPHRLLQSRRTYRSRSTGILYLNQFREGLIDARRQSLLTQAAIIAGAIAEGATSTPDAQVIDPLA